MAEHRLVIGLNAVLAAIGETTPHVLCVERDGGWGLPFGPFDPANHRTFEIGLRDFVTGQTAIPLGYVEQLYTFGDLGREAPRAQMRDSDPSDRVVSVGYLALSPSMATATQQNTAWHSWYDYFPWEDWRDGPPACLTDEILPALQDWATTDEKQARLRAAFGGDGVDWEEERALDRFELMYEVGLVAEAARDQRPDTHPTASVGAGASMISDHRRILATAIGRLRGKLRYRSIIFEMVPDQFTLTHLQTAIEAILGFAIHKQNFRRSLETAGLVNKTHGQAAATGGRPAALYRASALAREKHAPGLALPRRR